MAFRGSRCVSFGRPALKIGPGCWACSVRAPLCERPPLPEGQHTSSPRLPSLATRDARGNPLGAQEGECAGRSERNQTFSVGICHLLVPRAQRGGRGLEEEAAYALERAGQVGVDLGCACVCVSTCVSASLSLPQWEGPSP